MTQENLDIEQERKTIETARIRHGMYILPHLFTTAALFGGFYAIVAAMKNNFNAAAIAIFVAMLCDALDGRVARLTGTTSPFGAEFDSLSDLVSFGVAPALVIYSWGLHFLGKPGWLIAFCYVAATAVRLARFNVVASGKRFFHGIPCTPSAGVIAGFIWIQNIYHIPSFLDNILVGIGVIILAALMVSNIRYRSFKDAVLKNKVSFLKIVLVMLLFIAIAIDPPKVLFVIFTLYALSGPFMSAKRFWKFLQIKMKRFTRKKE